MRIQRLAALLGTKVRFLFADADVTTPNRRAESSGGAGAGAQLLWYQVGDASGRGGEVWRLETPGATEKIGDWVRPNDRGGDHYIKFSNLVGDTPTGETFDTWHKLSGAGSDNRSQTISVAPPDDEQCTFDVDLGTDGVDSRDGPYSWFVSADAS